MQMNSSLEDLLALHPLRNHRAPCRRPASTYVLLQEPETEFCSPYLVDNLESPVLDLALPEQDLTTGSKSDLDLALDTLLTLAVSSPVDHLAVVPLEDQLEDLAPADAQTAPRLVILWLWFTNPKESAKTGPMTPETG